MPGHFAFAVPGDLATPTGGYRYDRRIIKELRLLGWKVDIFDIGSSFPFPTPAERSTALRILSRVTRGCPLVIDGLAFGALPEAGRFRQRTPLIALVHQPLALEPSLNVPQAQTFRATERAALAVSSRAIATSETTASILATDYGVPSDRISVVQPGNDPASQAIGSRNGTIELLSVGSVVPGKGYDVLIPALAALADLSWHLTIAGDRTRDQSTAAQLDADIAAYGLNNKITVMGAVLPEQLNDLYLRSDVFVLASRFESYGMALTEAIAHGLPIVSTTAGAIPATVPSDVGLLVPPGESGALAQAIGRLVVDPQERYRRAQRARAAARQLPTWARSAQRFALAIELAQQTAHADMNSENRRARFKEPRSAA
jgi:glycosyltransferase involved in cell wall biosynthesis